jgi:hypothetical protein
MSKHTNKKVISNITVRLWWGAISENLYNTHTKRETCERCAHKIIAAIKNVMRAIDDDPSVEVSPKE